MSIFLFNFKKEFVPRVESGEKRQTIRRTRKDNRRPRPDDIAKLYTGLRTRSVRLLRTEMVVECMSVRMYYDDRVIVIDGRKLEISEASEFAMADGFESVSQMIGWFKNQGEISLSGNTSDFEGFCTRW